MRYVISCALVLAVGGLAVQASAAEVLSRAQKIEADWLRQCETRRSLTTADDALGAVDGVKDGSWAFHTGHDNPPWWQVDLRSVRALDRVLVFNRCDSGASRASRVLVLLSDDGETWRQVYQHTGETFYGASDGKPLAVALEGQAARFVRLQAPVAGFLHLDEVEVYGVQEREENLALWGPADQSSVSQWSSWTTATRPGSRAEARYPTREVIARGRLLADDLRAVGAAAACVRVLDEVEKGGGEGNGRTRQVASLRTAKANGAEAASRVPADRGREAYLKARWAIRRLAFANPLLDFDDLLFVKRAPGSFAHMSDQYYGWWSRPGGGVYILRGFATDEPEAVCLTGDMPEGSFLRPDLSYDGKRILFAFCKHYPHVRDIRDKVTKENLPEDAFYHVYEINVDGSGLRQLTRGRYDDFDARYLPGGEIVFLSTRRGQFVQCGKAAARTLGATLPDCFVRCGGDAWRPVAIYTLHVMDGEGGNLRGISPFENFEWTPSVTHDGRILYARWDYVDRDNMPYMSLWSVNPDGTNPRMVYGNFTHSPHCAFEARSTPASDKIIFTASAHHSINGGSLVMLDPMRGFDGEGPLTRLTPEVPFPEIEGWPQSYYANPYPLSERHYLVSWSDQPVAPGWPNELPVNTQGLYLCDAFGNLELIYRDPEVSCMCPIPVRAREMPGARAGGVDWDQREGRFMLLDVYEGLEGVARGAVKALRIVGVPAKAQPQMNSPSLGITRDDPGKYVLGTVAVEDDGSAHFRAPAAASVFFQALDEDGMAIQTMRTLTCVQPGQTLSCIGCHEPRESAPGNARATAASRAPSRITPGPEGSWPLRFDRLIQPVLDRRCVECHRPDGADDAARELDLTAAKAYESLISWGTPSIADHVWARYRAGRSEVGGCVARSSGLLGMLREGHEGVALDDDELERFITWLDTYAQRLGSFGADQEERLRRLRVEVGDVMEE